MNLKIDEVGASLSEYTKWDRIVTTIESNHVSSEKNKFKLFSNRNDKVIIKNAISFNNNEDFWSSILGNDFYGVLTKKNQKVANNQVIRLNKFTISEWVPWSPGRFWTDQGRIMRKEGLKRIDKKLSSDKITVLTPTGKSYAMLGGLGTLRFNEIELPDKKYRLLSATSSSNVNEAIPVVISKDIYERATKKVNDNPTFKASITGRYKLLPTEICDIIYPIKHIPKNVIWIDNDNEISKPLNNVKKGEKVEITPWTIFLQRENNLNKYHGCFVSKIDPSNEEQLKNASIWIEDFYVKEYSGKIITEFDGVKKRFSHPILSLSDVIKGKQREFRLLIDEIFKIKNEDERNKELNKALEDKWVVNPYV